MIVTLTLNPAIDTTLMVDSLTSKAVKSKRSDVGGKGLNVSNTLKALGVDSHAVLITAGAPGKTITDFLTAREISHQAFAVDGEIRENQKYIDETTQAMEEINAPGPHLSLKTLHAIQDYLDGLLKAKDVLVLTGSLPPGLPDFTYQNWIKRYKAREVYTVLDASSEALKKAIEAGPSLIKPNHHEWETLFGKPFNEATVQPDLDHCHALGIERVMITAGSHGAYASEGHGVLHQKALKLDVQSTVGAGDAFVAGAIMRRHDSIGDQLRFASAVASATTETPGTTPPTFEAVHAMMQRF
jgi:1-phosphofructokinase